MSNISPPIFTFTPRTYLHLDAPVSSDVAGNLATNPNAVAQHPFYPFIQKILVTQKIAKKLGGGVQFKPPKARPIAFAAHKDSHIFGYYSALIVQRYEIELRLRDLHEVVTAFRSINRKRNIHFANDAFEFIRAMGPCAVLALDVSDFFGTINHRILKRAWAKLLGRSNLPDDHYKVFKAICGYCYVDRDELFKALGIDPKRPRTGGLRRLCSTKEFKELVRAKGLCKLNRSGKGIPQGSPISAVLANLYMLEFDTALHTFVASHGGFYQRYCDDLLLVLPTAELRTEALSLIGKMLHELGISAHPDKTKPIDFNILGDRLVASKPLEYLGFTFDGQHKRIRPASIARYYKKMRRGVGRARSIRYIVHKRKGTGAWTPLRRRKLHILYSYLGRHNFLSYAFDAAKIMKDTGIKKQVKAHWKRLQAEIER